MRRRRRCARRPGRRRGRRVADAIGGPQALRRPPALAPRRGRGRAPAARQAELRRRGRRAGQADRGIDRVGGARAPAAEFDHRHADRAHVDLGDEARPRRRRADDDAGARQQRRRLGEEILGPAERATMRSNRSAAAPLSSARSQRARAPAPISRARPPERSSSAPSASVTAMQPRVAPRAGEDSRPRSGLRPRCRRRWRAARSCR